MTNKEFYGDKLLAIALFEGCDILHWEITGKICHGLSCEGCVFETPDKVEKWLNEEHVEPEQPLLENGDDLALGDWIMVRQNTEGENDWNKRLFICYKSGLFWTVEIGPDDAIRVDWWKQARLPMEGE